jgi:hypothetical protein
METLVSSLISEEMRARLQRRMQELYLVDENPRLRILGLKYILVNKFNCTSKFVDENGSFNQDEFKYTHLVALLRTQTKYSMYWNDNYVYLGIYDKYGKVSTLNFNSVQINTLYIASDFNACHYDSEIISGFKFKLLNNPFEDYIEKQLSSVKRSFKGLCPEGFGCDSLFSSEEFKINICRPFYKYYYITQNFDEFLKDMKTFGEEFDNKFYDSCGANLFPKMISDGKI